MSLVTDAPFIDTALLGSVVEASWNVMAPAQKPDFVFRRNGRVHLNRRGRQFSRLLAAELCASAVVMLDTPCSEVVWRVLATHSIRQFLLHFPSRASPCAITFRLSLPIRVSLSAVKFTSITHLDRAGLRLSQSMQLLGATPFGKAPKSQALFQSLHQAYF